MMGGRAAYVLATALFVGSAGVLGYFGYLYEIIPKATVYPILIFVGLEIAAQSFHATPVKHYPAVVLACVPALAYLALIFIDQVAGASRAELPADLQAKVLTIRMLSSGFIITSLVWASALTAMIDRRLAHSAAFFLIAAVFTLFGVMHSPAPGSPLFLPWALAADYQAPVVQYAIGYTLVAVLMLAWSLLVPSAEDSRHVA
jgi:AGZA family xanthine/uracil permease-like MFS transporter